jgi:hypothetical protein
VINRAANSREARSNGNKRLSKQRNPKPSMGMSTHQVKAAMGTPEKIVNLGPKQIYVYKDLKVTFLGGKVADVQ